MPGLPLQVETKKQEHRNNQQEIKQNLFFYFTREQCERDKDDQDQ
jgi:hypothetical protein